MKRILVLIVFCLSFVLSSCINSDANHIYTIQLSNYFNTINSVRIINKDAINEDDLKTYEKDMNEILERLSNEFDNLSSSSSTISLVNKNAGISEVKVSDEFIYVLKESLKMSEISIFKNKALFDITISPVWNLWNFEENYYSVVEKIPTKDEISSVLSLVDYTKIEIDEEKKTVFLKEEKMEINMGGIVKGYAADLLKEYLISKSIERAVIDIGSNIEILGSYYKNENNGKWKVYLKTPYISQSDEEYFDLYYFGSINVDESTVVTSGSYQKYIIDRDDNKYHHILDTRTGYPIDNKVVSVTVITDKSIIADGYSTTLFALGLEEGMKLVEKTPGLEAIFVVFDNNEYSVYESSGIKVELNEKLKDYNYNYQIGKVK